MIRFVALVVALAACEPYDMALPLSRDETGTPASPVPSNVFNKLEDMVIGGKHGLITIQVSPLRWVGSGGGVGVPLIYTVSETFWPTGVGGSNFMFGFERLPIGTVITEIRCIVKPNAANTMRVRWSKSVGGVGTILATSDATVSAADNTETLTGPFDPIASGTAYMLNAFRLSGAGESESVKMTEFDLYLP